MIVFSAFRILPRKFSGCIQKGNQVELQRLFSCHPSVDFHQVWFLIVVIFINEFCYQCFEESEFILSNTRIDIFM